jgi:general stress protein YciG
MTATKKRGFASMNAALQREIASKGGRAAHEKGKAHEFTPDEAREAGRKGGKIAHARGTAHRFTSEQARLAGRKGGRRPRVQEIPSVPLFGVTRHADATIKSEDDGEVCSCVRPPCA